MKIIKAELPLNSMLRAFEEKYDSIDSFLGKVSAGEKSLTSTEIGKAFFTSAPKWVDLLFTFRNKIAGVIGLKTSGSIENRKQQLDNFKCEKGERLGLFKIFEKTEKEVILGEDDKHLNFRVSLLLDKITDGKNKLYISTAVKYNNTFGRLYFLIVKPFHNLIVPKMLKGIIQKLEIDQ